MSKKNNRFDKIELDPTDVPKKPTIIEKFKFKRKLETGNEAQAERINNDLKKISADIDKQAAENERRRSIVRQQEMIKTIEKTRKEEELDLEIRRQFAQERKDKAKNTLWIAGFLVFGFIALMYFGGRQGRNTILEFIFAVIAVFFGYRGRRYRYGRRRDRNDDWWL